MNIKRFVGMVVLLACGQMASANATTLFSEDFETYLPGSNVIGQGGWTGSGFPSGPDPVSIGTTGVLTGKYLDGIAPVTAGNLNVVARAIAGGLPAGQQVVMTMDAYAIETSANSWIGLSSTGGGALGHAVLWDHPVQGTQGWQLEIRQVGQPIVAFQTGAGTGTLARFSIVLDPTSSQTWGTYDFGAGVQETPHFAFSATSMAQLAFVNVGLDYRGTNGIQVDNILVTAVPEPGLAILLISGVPMVLCAVKRRRLAQRLRYTPV